MSHHATANLPKRGPGRPKGAANKITKDIKQAILAAFDSVGGSDYLHRQATENPQAFMTLLGKVLPTQHQHSGGLEFKGDPVDRPPRETREEWLERRKRELGAAALMGPAAGAAE